MYTAEDVFEVKVQVREGDDCAWVEIPFRNPATCDHQSGMCEECEETWAQDHNVNLWYEDENGGVFEVRF